MTHNPIRSQWSKDLIALASKPCGTNAYHAARTIGTMADRAHATHSLKRLAQSGHLHCVNEDSGRTRLNQYFTNVQEAIAWKLLPDQTKPNIAFRDRADAARKNPKAGRRPPAPSHSIQSKTWARAPIGKILPQPVAVRTEGLALGYDCRVQMDPEKAKDFKGIFGSLPIGKYPE